MGYTGRVAQKFDLAQIRLHNQHVSNPLEGKPGDVVRHLVAVQAQDYYGALWALGLRLREAVEAKIDADFAAGRILRTHVMRPTWHFVAPEDIRWLLELTAPRVHTLNAYMYRDSDLDAKTFVKAHKAIEKALAGGNTLTRNELKEHLQKAGVQAASLRLTYIMMHAELERLICSGPRRGKQFTYALLDERAPQKKAVAFDREQALANFVLRYYTARGPATAQDFAYWSGLTVADAKAGLDMVKGQLQKRTIDEKEYWYSEAMGTPKLLASAVYLLPNYDEYGMAYKDHSASLDESARKQLTNYSFVHLIAIDGQLAGTWRRELKKNEVVVETRAFESFSPAESRLLEKAVKKYGEFLQVPVTLIG
jgi:hypothetical protein